jgi:hypothetical protein
VESREGSVKRGERRVECEEWGAKSWERSVKRRAEK